MLRAVLSDHGLILGEVILAAFRRVLKSKLEVPEDRISSAEATNTAIEIMPKPDKPSTLVVRDRDDRWVLATALAGRADVLVTGDGDLLSVAGEAPLTTSPPKNTAVQK